MVPTIEAAIGTSLPASEAPYMLEKIDNILDVSQNLSLKII
jgi:hypothetical protein